MKVAKQKAEDDKTATETGVVDQLKPYNIAINQMVDNLISGWDDDAKAYIKSANKTSAIERLEEYNRIKPLVQKPKPTATPTPGAGPTPRENNTPAPAQDDNTLLSLRRMINYGG